MRGVDVQGADIDAPWLVNGEGSLRVNGVNVAPFVDAELNRRFPGRAGRRAADPDGLRGEWSFAQTLRHLVLATDMRLGRAVLEIKQLFHPIGLRYTGAEEDGTDN